MNLLFYSNTCDYSKSVLLTLQKEGLLKYFKLICLDNPEMRKQVVDKIKYVPSMILVGCENVFTIAEIFKWIEAQKFLSKNNGDPAYFNTSPKQSPACQQANSSMSNKDKLNNLRSKLCTQTTQQTVSQDLAPFDLYSKGALQLTSVSHDDPIISGGAYSNINENTSNTIFTGEEISLSSKQHKKLVNEYKNIFQLQDIERNMMHKKPKQKIDFTQTKVETSTGIVTASGSNKPEDLVHTGFYTEVVKDLTKSTR